MNALDTEPNASRDMKMILRKENWLAASRLSHHPIWEVQRPDSQSVLEAQKSSASPKEAPKRNPGCHYLFKQSCFLFSAFTPGSEETLCKSDWLSPVTWPNPSSEPGPSQSQNPWLRTWSKECKAAGVLENLLSLILQTSNNFLSSHVLLVKSSQRQRRWLGSFCNPILLSSLDFGQVLISL